MRNTVHYVYSLGENTTVVLFMLTDDSTRFEFFAISVLLILINTLVMRIGELADGGWRFFRTINIFVEKSIPILRDTYSYTIPGQRINNLSTRLTRPFGLYEKRVFIW